MTYITTNRIFQIPRNFDGIQQKYLHGQRLASPPQSKLLIPEESHLVLDGLDKECAIDQRIQAIRKASIGSVITIEGATQPITTTDIYRHPRPGRSFGVSTVSSYLNRHQAQLVEFGKQVLPLLVESSLVRDLKELQFAVVGSGFDEHASIMGAIIEEFDEHPQWGGIAKMEYSY
jgi:hypothetical protein